MSANRRRHHRRRHHANRRRHHRRNGRHVFRRNEGFVTTLTSALKVGLIAGAGFAGHKAATKLLSDMVLDKVIGAPATPVTAPAAPAVSGLEVLQPYKRILAGLLSGAVGVVAVNKLVKDAETKKIVIAGIAGSFLHTLFVDLLTAFGGATGGKVAAYLSGYDASSAYSLGASIMPHYAAVGEYFDSGVSGLGEYFESGVAGLGNYGGNPDIYQAQAGFGSMPDGNSMHVDPGSDLDRELTLAEAAAGVGMLPSYEAQAGLGDYTGAGGRQAIPSRSTWVPGMTNPGVWAPVTAVAKPQSSTAMVPAGILQTSGGQGVFG